MVQDICMADLLRLKYCNLNLDTVSIFSFSKLFMSSKNL